MLTEGGTPPRLVALFAHQTSMPTKARAKPKAPQKKARSARPGRSAPRRTPSRVPPKPLAGNPFVALLQTVKGDVDARLLGLLDTKLDEAERYGDDVVAMIGALRDLCMRGGKRLRPALVAAGLRSVSRDANLDMALDVGTALELLQAYFLIHDDWMDGDLTRRGGPSVHAQLTHRYGSEHQGAASAVLAGDYAAALALEALAKLELPSRRRMALLTTFAQMQTDAIMGQQLDLAGPRDIETMYELKTGSYTVRGPLRLGALLGGADTSQLNALDRYAMPAGVAFQLRDDLLSAFGEPQETGKPYGGDVAHGKRTLLMAYALKTARGAGRDTLQRAFGNPKASERQLRQALAVVEQTGARERVEARIAELVATALKALEGTRLTESGILLLRGAARALAERRS